MLSNCLSRERRARRSLSKKLEEGKTENALSVLQQASWGIILVLAGLAGLGATLVSGRAFRNDFNVYDRDAAFMKGLGSKRVITGVASGTMTVLGFSIAALFSVLYKLWVQWQLEKGITPFEVILPAQQALGWLTLLLSWCATGLAKWSPSCAKGCSMAGHPPKSSTVWLLMASVLSTVVLLGCNLVPFVLVLKEVSAPVHLNGAMAPQSISVSIPSACNRFSSYYSSGDSRKFDFEQLNAIAADGDSMWVRNVFDTGTLDVVNASKKHNGLLGRVEKELGWSAKQAEPDGLRERLRMALGGDEYAKNATFSLNDTWPNSVLFANGRKLNGCTAKALKGEKLNSANKWSVEENQKILVGVVSFRWTELYLPINATQKIIKDGTLERREYVDGPDCPGCWGVSVTFETVRLLLRFDEGEVGDASELTVVLQAGGWADSFALRASLLEVTGELSVEGRDNMVLGSLQVRNYTVESRHFARTFACNILQVLRNEQLYPYLEGKCSNQSGPWHADMPVDMASVTRMIRTAARLVPGGNVRAEGPQLQLPGTLAAILGYTIAMQFTNGTLNKTDVDLGYGLRSQTVTVILPKMRTMLYTCIVLLEVGAAAGLLGASLYVASMTSHNSMKVDPYLFFSRLSKDEKERLEVEDEVIGTETTAWMMDGVLALTDTDGQVQLTRQKKASGNSSPR